MELRLLFTQAAEGPGNRPTVLVLVAPAAFGVRAKLSAKVLVVPTQCSRDAMEKLYMCMSSCPCIAEAAELATENVDVHSTTS